MKVKLFTAWKDNLVGVVSVVGSKVSLDVKTLSEEPQDFIFGKLLSECEVEALYGSDPPFGVIEQYEGVPLYSLPSTDNPASYLLIYRIALLQIPEFTLSSPEVEGNSIEIGGDMVRLDTFTCSCMSREVPCKHVVIAVNSLPPSIFQEFLLAKVEAIVGSKVELETPFREWEEKGEEKVTLPPSISAALWNCQHLGCYLEQKRPRLEEWESRVKGLEFFNIDGVTFFPRGAVVFVEWKVMRDISPIQYTLFQRLSQLSQHILVVVCVGDPRTLTVHAVRLFHCGETTDWLEMSGDEVLQLIVNFGRGNGISHLFRGDKE